MAIGDGVATPAFGDLKVVAPSDVESELAKRIAAGDPAGGESASRACTLNLIVYVERIADVMPLADAIKPLEAAHPMRVILVTLDENAPSDHVQTWVDASCADGGPVCSELVVIRAHTDASARVASTVLSLLGADLPVALWWRSDSPFLSRLFKGLEPIVDKVVVDSIRFGDGPAALDTLHRLSSQGVIADMNWFRIATWRATLSACFDDPSVLALLPSIDKSEIEYSLGPDASLAQPSARSLLLAGWIVSRLPAIAGRGDIKAAKSGWATPGAILALRLRSSKSRAGVSISWPSEDEGIAAVAYDTAGSPMRRWRFSPDPEDEADLLYRCIDSTAPDPVLEAALEVG